MKIKGVKGGKERGEVVEFTPPEKVPLAVQDAVRYDTKWHKEHFNGMLASLVPSSFRTLKLNYSPKGDPLKGKWQNNTYSAEGETQLMLQHVAKNAAAPNRKITFRIRFEDTLDELGQPDLAVTHFELI